MGNGQWSQKSEVNQSFRKLRGDVFNAPRLRLYLQKTRAFLKNTLRTPLLKREKK